MSQERVKLAGVVFFAARTLPADEGGFYHDGRFATLPDMDRALK